MGITVERILKLPVFKGAALISGENGKNNIVEYVDVMEVPDIVNWLSPNEMLLTTAFAMKNDIKAQENLIVKLSEIGAAALCIKPGRFIDKIPEALIELSNKLNFPLIQISSEVPYVDIISEVLNEILNEKGFILQSISRVHDSLMNIVLMGGGLQEICNKLMELTGIPILILDKNCRIISLSSINKLSCSLSDEVKKIEKFKKSNLSYSEPIIINDENPYIIIPIVIEQSLYGFLAGKPNKIIENDLNIKLLQQGAIVAALEFIKEKNTQEIKKRLMKDLISDMLYGNIDKDVLIERGKSFGWDFKNGRQVIALKVDRCKELKYSVEEIQKFRSFITDMVKITAESIDNKAIVTEKNGMDIIFIKPPIEYVDNKKNLYDYSREFALKVQRELYLNIENIDLSIGIGRYDNDITEVHKSYQEAKKSLEMGLKIFGKGHVTHFDDIGIYKILLKVSDKDELFRFCLNLLKPLIEYDRENNTELQRTLEVYLKNNKKLSETAKELYIHRNTVRYRIDKIIDILNVDMEDGDILFNLYFSLKAFKILNL